MKFRKNRFRAYAPYIVLSVADYNRLQNFFNKSPKIKRAGWYAEAIIEKLEQEDKKGRASGQMLPRSPVPAEPCVPS